MGVQLQGVAWTWTVQPASFQGNRDESTNVDMSLIQRDAQVSVMARPAYLAFLSCRGGGPCILASQGKSSGVERATYKEWVPVL